MQPQINEPAAPERKRIFSAIQPSGMLTLGNYLGALKNWKDMLDDYDCVYSVADLHAITVRQEPAKFRRQVLETFALLMAVGIDTEKGTLFIQSSVPEHSQLAWILACNTQFGELARMTQFKDKSASHADNINAGLFTYPSLQAADILLYNAHLVPIGADQKQHLELSRTIAERFNHFYGPVFTVPEPYIPKMGAKVMSLQDPAKKMSKSDANPNAYIALLDPPEVIVRKLKRAVTDSETEVRCAEGKDGINNLMTIYSCVTGKNLKEIEAEFDGRGYGEFKAAVGEAIAEELRPVQRRFSEYMSDKGALEKIYREQAEKARYTASRTLAKAMKKVGFIR